MELNFNLQKNAYYKATLSLLNVIAKLKLSDLEIDIIATLVANKKYVVNTDNREMLRKELGTGKYVLNNKISDLKEKSILYLKDNDKSLYIHPNLLNSLKDTNTSFNLIMS